MLQQQKQFQAVVKSSVFFHKKILFYVEKNMDLSKEHYKLQKYFLTKNIDIENRFSEIKQ